jgi:Protein of unknown function (DUF4058)
MPSPLPGMNPYLESPELWSEFHSRMIVAIADALDTTLSQAYRVAVEKRVYLTQGEEIQERYLKIYAIATRQVVTVIEILSPNHPQSSADKDTHEQNHWHIATNQTNRVAINLLHSGECYPFDLRQPIPPIQVPLAADRAVTLDLQPLLHQIYDRARLALAIDYQKPPIPKLAPDDRTWLNAAIGQVH